MCKRNVFHKLFQQLSPLHIVAALFIAIIITLGAQIAARTSTGYDADYHFSNDSVSDISSDDMSNKASWEIVQTIDATLADFSISDYYANSTLICTASYIGCSDGMMVRPLNGADPMIFTDYYFDISSVYKGQPKESENRLTVRQRGGEVGSIKMVNNGAATLEDGATYLLFLYSIADGSDYNTEGPQFYLIGGEAGCWIQTESGFESPMSGDVVQVNELQQATLSMSSEKLSEVNAIDQFEKIKTEYESGLLPKEYYLEMKRIAEKESSSYATVMTESEIEAYHNKLIDQLGSQPQIVEQ
ncbi:hypothetical protein [Enorma phocaeensis]|uniref:hypothetical protein n=1 Tax=Enorma phocaeensis TaxID=1871019 RepID=UPI0019581306|nr:hypothetical protein [Enorma phocaeensis]MBM6952522.1 hypothetical protein [Enorma phocaeensis]